MSLELVIELYIDLSVPHAPDDDDDDDVSAFYQVVLVRIKNNTKKEILRGISHERDVR